MPAFCRALLKDTLSSPLPPETCPQLLQEQGGTAENKLQARQPHALPARLPLLLLTVTRGVCGIPIIPLLQRLLGGRGLPQRQRVSGPKPGLSGFPIYQRLVISVFLTFLS